MTTKDKHLIEDLKALKEHCESYEMCNDSCVFYINDMDISCAIKGGCPCNWTIPSIWSSADIALAKALMAVGVDELYCPLDPHRYIYLYAANKSDMGELKADAFPSLCPGESIKLSVIAKEQA